MSFILNDQIRLTCFELGDGPVSKILLKNNADYPWLILVPKVENIQEIDQLPTKLRYLLTDEICHLSQLVRTYFNIDKVNIGALGNIVSQLHIHIIGRKKGDKLWPHSVWQETESTFYEASTLQVLKDDLCKKIKVIFQEDKAFELI
ncbi:diadenosine tetraphosphate (Ap4A) hydrolase-like HIT family hydrolase [Legionella busanensis]|uniref:Diadenosine tetraphosphate (Ap4A) hydrolase-like HIT family hydrolase n=1 Tax=Legionella busanensis TaxID=190655 RepID=A0A378JMM7_9GAMM|nr:HIT family protein [Legionella busanensis]STX52317.1 diadenosine tetraphosphate (Ap4A) hydrolase-like HIT family hydrolase [Legionella busanensis]